MSPMLDPYYLGEADDLRGEWHLFLDDFAIEDRWDAVRTQNEPVTHPRNPVVVPDQPWELSIGSPSVLYDAEEKRFRMWYALYNTAAWTRGSCGIPGKRHEYSPYSIAYAESEDGVHWQKPLFDRFPLREYEVTNIVYTGNPMANEFDVTYTPEPLAHYGRFMVSYGDNVQEGGFEQQELNDYLVGNHLCLAFSDDGIEWRPYEGNPVAPALDVQHNLYWDERLGLWLLGGRPFARAATEDLYRDILTTIKGGEAVSFARGGVGRGQIGRAGAVENVRTRVTIAVSPDLKTWHPPREVLCPDAKDDEEQMFFDHLAFDRYGSQYIGFLAVQPRNADAAGWVGLTGSPDGLHWYRPRERTPFLAPGPPGSWDAGHVWTIKNIVPYGDWIHLYYAGSMRPWRFRFPDNARGIGLARIRRGRFVGYYGDVNGGHLISREVKLTGPQLLINCSAQHRAFSREWHGSIHTELVERTGRAIEGYTYADCDPNHVDDFDHPVTWKGKNVSALIGRSVYVRFFMRNSFVFGFRFGALQ